MPLRSLRIIRLSLGVTSAVAVSYGYAWMLFFVTPIFAFIFLAMPAWIGGKMAVQLLLRLGFSLLIGIIIAEFFLNYPILCVPLYGLLFFFIYYNDTPSAPPMSTLFMTLAVTLIPIMSFSGATVAYVIGVYLLVNMGLGMIFAWLFHIALPDSLASQSPQQSPPQKPQPPPPLARQERIRLAMVSTVVAISAVLIFFSLNLSQYTLAMIYICFMAGTPNTNASVAVMKANSTATCIGGVAVIMAFNLLVAVPAYPFLLALTFLFSLFFSIKIYGGETNAAAYSSGFTAFLVLLGTSTGVDQTASSNFYLRIAQVLFAGIFTLGALIIVEHLSRPQEKGIRLMLSKMSALRKKERA